ncbi:aldo/keto reductase [Mesorhizobium sp. M3A.F.Ca.ET.080.04.2.1]|uniref:aldo/keto reductase n=1 Tax=Mesorhizobium sp. M3A.F.Ca.ET.080.04.2.1 TaxID=2493676 RepID=UPI000F75FCC8|nr:aldo/keto reductase [Mesorhizobium sp. M3A.F.Ca.ET.080.04.2.1]AZO07883.1 aldo/keto reductase [Mesorhizobium sp. M3A.F.Ca.ET.080.04.2.1]RWF18737.1 MAG: aldo/keto reductase [Mesorhizobium sp.]
MQYRNMGRSGLKVSALSMGTLSFGEAHGVAEARRMVDVCLDGGVNMFDTANMYNNGRSEEVLGEVLDGRRNQVLITSKARMRVGDGANDEGGSRYHIVRECERSLKRLRTDYIDLFLMHEWDGSTPLEETIEALDALVRHGKVRYIGCSNYSGWHLMKALHIADTKMQSRFIAQQIHYTLEAREAEYELLPIAIDQGVGVMVWSPLTSGLLSGFFSRESPPDWSGPNPAWSGPPIRDKGRLWRIVDVITDIAGARGIPMSHVALAWVLARPGVASVVTGGLTEEHFRENIAAVDVALSDQELELLNEISRLPYIYPYWHQRKFAADLLGPADWALHSSF